MISQGDKLPENGRVTAGHITEQRPLSSVLTRQQHIANMSKKYANSPLSTLSHHLDLLWLREAYGRLNKSSAPGLDNQSVEDYGKDLDNNLSDLLERAKSGRYRAPNVKRVHIPKNETETRPIGIPTTENKVLERAIAMLLEPVYEVDFYDCSYGFRPNRSAHQALESIRETVKTMGGCWVIDVDIRQYFDSIPHDRLRAILGQRVKDGVVLRLIGKWLKAGVFESGQLSYSDSGTPQGGVISPLLSNIYLHEVLDKWFHEEVLPGLDGMARLVRFADDFVLLVEYRDEAESLLEKLPERFGEYGLTVHPDKTCMVDFRHPWQSGKKPETFDFLGFTHYWGSTRNGGYAVKKKTASKKLNKSLKSIHHWCKCNRHKRLVWQHRKLSEKVQGHYAYYGVRGNVDSLSTYLHRVCGHWYYWLNRRSNKPNDMSWLRFVKLLEGRYALPRARVIHTQSMFYQPSLVF